MSDIKYDVQNDWYRDYIKLSWDKHDEVETIKVMKVSYPQKEFEIYWEEEFIDYDIREWKNMYFVVSYNDCLDFSYSDIIKVDYKKQNDNPFLSLNDNIISFLNYEGDEIKLSCFIWEKKIIEKKLQDDYRYMIDEKYLTENFYCSVEFLENDKIIKSNIIYNNLYWSSMTIKEFLQFVYWKWFTNEEINKKYYYLLNNIDLDSNITYEKLSTFLINIYADLIIKNDKLSFKLLQNLWLINNDTISTKVVKYEDLIYFISIINSKNNFREDVLLNINTLFELNTKAVFNDFIEIYTINDQLDRLSKVQKEELISCFNFVSCDNYNYYYNFLNKVEKLIDNNEYKKLDIDINSKKEITWLEYSKIIFKIISKQEFYDKWYKVQEYNDFINILNEAIFYWEEIIDKKLDYFTYKWLNIELITNRELYTSIQYLTKNHLKTINKIYKNIVNKEKLLLILREYLEK